MDLKRLLETTWNTTLSSIGPLILVTLVYAIVMGVSFGLLAPVTTAGYTRSLLTLLRDGKSPQIKDLFSEMSLFLPLTIFSVLALIAVSIGFMFLVVPGFVIIAVFAFAALYLVPLMIDKRMGILEAMQESWDMAVLEPVSDHIIVVVVYLFLTALGGSVPLGFLVTQPFATIFILCAYQYRLREPFYGPPPSSSSPD